MIQLIIISSTSMMIISGICLLAVLPVTFIISMQWGPKLFLPAVAVGVIFFLWQWLGMSDIAAMFDLYLMKPILWLLVIDGVLMLVFRKFDIGMLCFHGALVSLLGVLLLFSWTKTDKTPFPDLSDTQKLMVQNMNNTQYVTFENPAEFADIIEDLEDTRFTGSYWEAVDYQSWQQMFCVRCLDSRDEELVTFYFITDEYLLINRKGNMIAYATPGRNLPADKIIELHDAVLPPT